MLWQFYTVTWWLLVLSQLPIVPQGGAESRVPLLEPWRSVYSPRLGQCWCLYAQLLWIHEYTIYVMYWGNIFSIHPLIHFAFYFLSSLCMGGISVPFRLHQHLFFRLWPVMSFCINCLLPFTIINSSSDAYMQHLSMRISMSIWTAVWQHEDLAKQ